MTMHRLLRLFVALGAAACPIGALHASAEDPTVPVFVEETASGVDSSYDGGWEFMVGGGVATFDCSGDGLPDMLLSGG